MNLNKWYFEEYNQDIKLLQKDDDQSYVPSIRHYVKLIGILNKQEFQLQDYRKETERLEGCINNYKEEAINKDQRIAGLENTIQALIKRLNTQETLMENVNKLLEKQ